MVCPSRSSATGVSRAIAPSLRSCIVTATVNSFVMLAMKYGRSVAPDAQVSPLRGCSTAILSSETAAFVAYWLAMRSRRVVMSVIMVRASA